MKVEKDIFNNVVVWNRTEFLFRTYINPSINSLVIDVDNQTYIRVPISQIQKGKILKCVSADYQKDLEDEIKIHKETIEKLEEELKNKLSIDEAIDIVSAGMKNIFDKVNKNNYD